MLSFFIVFGQLESAINKPRRSGRLSLITIAKYGRRTTTIAAQYNNSWRHQGGELKFYTYISTVEKILLCYCNKICKNSMEVFEYCPFSRACDALQLIAIRGVYNKGFRGGGYDILLSNKKESSNRRTTCVL